MGMGVCKLYLNLSVGGLRVGGRWAASILIDAAWTTHNVHTQRGTHTKRHAMKEPHKNEWQNGTFGDFSCPMGFEILRNRVTLFIKNPKS